MKGRKMNKKIIGIFIIGLFIGVNVQSIAIESKSNDNIRVGINNGGVLTLRPNNHASYNQHLHKNGYPGDICNFQEVDDTDADDDATYVYPHQEDNADDSYNFQDHTTGTGNINWVRVYIRGKGDGCAVIPRFYDGTTYYEFGYTFSLKSWWETFYATAYITNPVTGLAWTWDDIDNLQVGFRSHGACGPKITQIYVEVDYESGNNPPNIPSNPNPANHDTEIDINADLSWTGGDPDSGDTVTYDVYFGSSNDPPIVSVGQSDTIYDPGTMNGNSMYYWKIVSKDNHDVTTWGPVWDFVTGIPPNNPPNLPDAPTGPTNGCTGVEYTYEGWTIDPDGDQIYYQFDWGYGQDASDWVGPYPSGDTGSASKTWNSPGIYEVRVRAKDDHDKITDWSDPLLVTIVECDNLPDTPSNPRPSNHATDQSVNVDLSWSCSDPNGDPLTYDVYFGTNSDPQLKKSSHTSTTYDPGTLSPSTKYYWKIVAKDDQGHNTEGPKWEFTTTKDPNDPPNIPEKPIGQYYGFTDRTYLYKTQTTDPNGDNIEYGWDWNADQVIDTWGGRSEHHKWENPGTYKIKVIAKDDHDAFSEWSEALTVKIINRITATLFKPVNSEGEMWYSYYPYNTGWDHDQSNDITGSKAKAKCNIESGAAGGAIWLKGIQIPEVKANTWFRISFYTGTSKNLKVTAKVILTTADFDALGTQEIRIGHNHNHGDISWNVIDPMLGWDEAWDIISLLLTLLGIGAAGTIWEAISAISNIVDGVMLGNQMLQLVDQDKAKSYTERFTMVSKSGDQNDVDIGVEIRSSWGGALEFSFYYGMLYEIFVDGIRAPEKTIITPPSKFVDNQELQFELFSIDPNNDDVRYFIDWGDGSDPEWTEFSRQPLVLQHIYNDEGTYTISVLAQDTDQMFSQEESLNIQIVHKNQAPVKPNKPSGPTYGRINKKYTYTAVTTDPDGDKLQYLFDWGNEEGNSGWIPKEHVESGKTVSASYTWENFNSGTLRVKARDEYGAESEWSDGLQYRMPKSRVTALQKILNFFPLLARTLQLSKFLFY